MISKWMSVIVMLVTFVNGARNGECRCRTGNWNYLTTNYNDNSYYHFVPFALEILPSKRLNI